MAIQLTGLGGFDSSSVVSQLVSIAQQPITALQTQQSLVDSATTTMGDFSSLLSTLKGAATALSTTSGFSSMAASSSDSGIVATVTGSSMPSSYSVDVTQLARAQKTRSDPQTSATTALGQTGTLTLTVGSGSPVNVSIVATDSLSDIASKITNSGARVNGAIVNAGGSYRLSLQGLDTGAANAFTITEGSGISLGLNNAANQPPNGSAQDAKLTVDGLSVTSATNQISGAIPGVTLALTKPTTSTATIGVAADSTALKQKITSFMNAYNSVVSAAHADTGYGTTKAQNSVLQADYAIRRSLDQLSGAVSGFIPGAAANYSSLATVGLSLNTDGTMQFDGTKLDDALSKDPNAVQKLFVTDTTTGATGVMKGLADSIDGMINSSTGSIQARIDALKAQSKSLGDSATTKQTQVDAYQTQLKAQFAALDQAMTQYQSMSTAIAGIASAG